MKEYNLTEKNRTDLNRDLAQLEGTGLAEKTPLCQTCDRPLTEGQRLTVYTRQTANTATFELGAMTCVDHHHDQRTQFNRSVRELIIEGCVGRCSDHAKQASWPILLHPQARTISPRGTTDGYMLPASPWFYTTIGLSHPDDIYRDLTWTVSPTTIAANPTGEDGSLTDGGETDG